MNDDMNLDELLSQPLPEVADNGFSDRVVVRVKAEERRYFYVIAIACVVAATALCVLVPMHDITAAIGVTVYDLGTSAMLAWAGAALVLTYLVDRLLADRQLLQL